MALDVDGVICEFLKHFQEEFVLMVHKNMERSGKVSNPNITLISKPNKDST